MTAIRAGHDNKGKGVERRNGGGAVRGARGG